MAARSIICVLLDFFITSIELEDRPNLRGKPVIVGGDPKKRGLVVAASPEALALGVTPGMPAWEALRLCPQATLLPPHLETYHARAQMALGILSLYSDNVEHNQLDCFYMSMTGNAGDIAPDIQRQLAEQTRISASVGVAANKLVAHMAARLRMPGGMVVVPPGQEADFLAPLPLQWLVSDDKAHGHFKRLGLRSIGDLARTPEHLLVSYLGETGKVLLRRAQGKDARLLRSTQQREAIEWEHVFDRAMTDREALRRWVAYLAGQIGQDLRSHKQKARMLTLTLGHMDGAPLVWATVLPKVTDLDYSLRDAVFRLLQAWDGRTGVVSLGIEASVFSGEPGFQLHLFADDEKETKWEDQQRRLDHAKNGINKRYGQGAVMAAMLLDDEILEAMGKRKKAP